MSCPFTNNPSIKEINSVCVRCSSTDRDGSCAVDANVLLRTEPWVLTCGCVIEGRAIDMCDYHSK